MENNLIAAFSKILFESCGYGMAIYLLFRISQKFIASSNYRYWLAFTALTICFGHFALSVLTVLSESSADDLIVSPITTKYPQLHFTPSLLQQAEAWVANYSRLIFGLYLTGFAIQLMRLVTGMGKVLWLKNDAALQTNEQWTALLEQLINRTGARKISVYFSDKISVPSTIGFFKPVILFPIAAINQLTQEQAEAILLHELAHIKRHDYLWNLFQSIMEALMFFNPAVWLLGKEIRKEREYCCDDLVLNQIPEPIAYAKALLAVADTSRNNLALAMASSGNSKYPLLNRIKRMTIMKTLPDSPQQKGMVLLMVIAISLSLAFAVPSRTLEQAATAKLAAAKNVISAMRITAAAKSPATKSLAALPARTKINIKAKHVQAVADTSKKKYKIVVKDEKGIETTYNSISELPVESRKEFLNENASFNFNADTLNKAQLAAIEQYAQKWSKQINSPEWKKQQELVQKYAANMSKLYSSPEWKKQMESIQKNAELMAKQFNTPEWRKQQEEITKAATEMASKFNTPEFRKQQAEMMKNFNSDAMKKYAEEMKKQVNSPEWKRQQETMKKYAEQMKKQFNSPEWKKQQEVIQKHAEDVRKQFNSREWREQQEVMKKNYGEAMRKQLEGGRVEWIQQPKEMLKELDQLKINKKGLEKLKTDSVKKN